MRAEPQARALRGTGGQRSQGQCPVATVVTINVAWLWSSGSHRERCTTDGMLGCRPRPLARRLVRGEAARAGRERGPCRVRFPPCVRVGGSVSLPRFSPSGSLPLSSRVAPSAHEDRWRRESLVEPRPRREQGPSLSAKPSPVGVMVRRTPRGPFPRRRCRSTRARIPGGAPRIERRSGAAALTGAWIPPRGCGALLGRLSGERWPVSSTSATRAETLRTQAGNAHRPRNLH